jgi:hypothetical protein
MCFLCAQRHPALHCPLQPGPMAGPQCTPSWLSPQHHSYPGDGLHSCHSALFGSTWRCVNWTFIVWYKLFSPRILLARSGKLEMQGMDVNSLSQHSTVALFRSTRPFSPSSPWEKPPGASEKSDATSFLAPVVNVCSLGVEKPSWHSWVLADFRWFWLEFSGSQL